MDAPFDPYHKWLGIPPEEQPPNHYRLLGLRMFENDDDVIENAAESKMLLLRSRQTGPNAADCQRLLNEIAAARHCLLDEDSRMRYNDSLLGKSNEKPLGAAPSVPGASANSERDLPTRPPTPMVETHSADQQVKPHSKGAAAVPRVPMGQPKGKRDATSASTDSKRNLVARTRNPQVEDGSIEEQAQTPRSKTGAPAGTELGRRDKRARATAPPREDTSEWHVMRPNGEYFGRASTARLKELAAFGEITADFRVAKDGSKSWIPLDKIVQDFGTLRDFRITGQAKQKPSRRFDWVSLWWIAVALSVVVVAIVAIYFFVLNATLKVWVWTIVILIVLYRIFIRGGQVSK